MGGGGGGGGCMRLILIGPCESECRVFCVPQLHTVQVYSGVC